MLSSAIVFVRASLTLSCRRAEPPRPPAKKYDVELVRSGGRVPLTEVLGFEECVRTRRLSREEVVSHRHSHARDSTSAIDTRGLTVKQLREDGTA